MSSIRSDGPTRFEKEFMVRLIARRKKLGMTQVELAERTGMTQPNLARYESLSVSPTLSALSRICEALSVDIELDPIGYIGRRILVIGCPGSGKSYFSKKLSSASGIPRIHIDNLYWNEDKTHISREELLAKCDEVFALDSFLLDGNYISTLENRLDNGIDTVFFLDLPLDACLGGIRQRVGRKRDDLPFVESAEDGEELIDLAMKFESETRPLILASLQKHPEIRLVRFKSRGEIDSYLASLS